MSTITSDLKYGFRQLHKSPGFTLVAVLTLALGMGASTSLFSVLQALILDPFPFPESDRIAYVWNEVGWPLSVPDFKDIEAQNTSFETLGAFDVGRYNVGFESSESRRDG